MIRAATNAVTGGIASALGVSLTRGGLVAATLKATVNGQEIKIPCHFNPSQIAVAKTLSYTENEVIGANLPKIEFKMGAAQTLTLDLWFDSTTTLANDNIRKVTDKLWKFALVDASTKDSKSQKAEPPIVTFTWEQFTFTGVVTSMTHTYVLFNETGAPLRAKVNIALKQKEDAEIAEIQTSTVANLMRAKRLGSAALSGMLGAVLALSTAAAAAASTNANSTNNAAGKTASSTSKSAGVVPQEGTRIDHVAAATTGDSSNQRKVAENNNIDNPMKMPKGQVIS